VIEQAVCPVLIDREEEVAALDDALIATAQGEGRTVVLWGEAGSGKTRVAGELRRRAARLGCTVLWGGCSEAELSLPYLPVVQAIGNHLTNADVGPVIDRLGPLGRELAPLFPQLGLDLPRRDRDPAHAKLRLFEGVVALLGAVTGKRALLLVVEDLHWADASTRELLDYTVRRLGASPILVLATCRSDELHRRHPLLRLVHGWRRSGLAESVTVAPLLPDQVAEMVSAILDEEAVSGEFAQLFHARSAGNPFAVEEMLKEAIDRGDVFRTTSGWSRRALADLSLPRSVSDSILVRVERLPALVTDVLQAAAVLGASFSHPVLATVARRPEPRVLEALSVCVNQQLLEADPSDGGRFAFRHALTRSAVYEELLPPRRQELHGRAAAALRAVPGTAAVELAHHLLAAGREAEAVPTCLEAAEMAMARCATHDAALLYERCIPHLAGERERGRVLCQLGEALRLSDDPAAGLRHLEAGVALLEGSGDEVEAARHRLNLGRCFWERDRPDLARDEYERARVVLESAGASNDLALCYVRLAQMRITAYEAAEAQALAERAIDVATRAGAEAPRIWAHTYLGAALCLQGRVTEGLAAVDRSHREAGEHDFPWIADTALLNAINMRFRNLLPLQAAPLIGRLRSLPVGSLRELMVLMFETYLSQALGDLERALSRARDYLTVARQKGQLHYENDARLQVALALTDLDRLDEARAELPQEGGEREFIADCWAARMRLHLAAGETSEAAAVAQQVLDARGWTLPAHLAEQAVEALLAAGRDADAEALLERAGGSLHADANRPLLQRAQGLMALARGEAEAARRLLGLAATGLSDSGERLEELRTLVPLARAHARAGDRPAAEAALLRAIELAHVSGARRHTAAAITAGDELGLSLAGAEALPLPAMSAPADGAGAGEIAAPAERLVTVMFADIRGYTEMTGTLAPAQLTERVATFQRWATREVERHHGIVDKFAGDAVMATFNVSRANLDHCVAALQAGLSLRDRSTLIDIGIGVGIAAGPAVVGRLAAGANLSVLGETTNLAARLQAEAGPGELLLSEEAFRRSREWLEERGFDAEPVSLQLRGIANAVTAHRLRAPRVPAGAVV